MKVSEKAADAQRKTCKRAPESLGNKIYINVVARDFCTALFVYQKFSLLVQYLKCILIHDLNSMWWQEHSEKKKSMSMYLRSRAAADLRGPSCARWLEFSAVLCVWLETELMHHCWTDSEWKMTHIMPPLKSSFITCNRQTDGWISWRQKSSTLFRVLTSFGVSSSFKTQCFVQMFNSESEIIHKSIHNRFSINTSKNQLLVFPARPFASSWKSSYSCYKCFHCYCFLPPLWVDCDMSRQHLWLFITDIQRNEKR